ncbi:MAG: helix-turn-helix transcriptional regulator [Polyangiaceae bacterium]|nr:helix-turn-helix transcriptional regulator [Myxococcales bacterium]MCB9585859.1 helix-turn-helix transcriptional regulator [Polyangiaceae bacterium]MCB9607212.1 helix-turn-helix transcriptional regulator [Polyangiaceae bacterium]
MRHDPVGILEVCYSLTEGFDDWLARLTHALQPSLDVGLGVFCTGMYLTPGGPEHAFVRTLGDVPPNIAELLRLSQQTMPDPGEVTTTFASSRFTRARSEMSPNNLRRFDELAHPAGVRDGVGMVFSDGTLGVLVGGFHPEEARVGLSERRMWSQIAIHLSHGLRLRRRIARTPVAILESSGRLVHAESQAQGLRARELLRRHVRSMEKARSNTRRSDAPRAISLWQGLVDGRWSLVDRFEADGKRFVVALENPVAAASITRLSPKEAAVCQLAAQGHPLTAIASALGSRPSTVSTQLRQGMRKLKVSKRAELAQTWALLARGESDVLALAAIDRGLVCVRGTQAAQVPRSLTAAEQDVAKLVASGLSNREIAIQRGVSAHTVANQIQRIFDKLGVSSRLAVRELIEA